MMTTAATPRAVEEMSLPTPIIQGANNLSRKQTLLNSLKRQWEHFKVQVGTGAALSSDSASTGEPDEVQELEEYKLHLPEASLINEIIIDRNWADDLQSSVTPESGVNGNSGGGHLTHTASDTSITVDGFWDSWALLSMLRWRTWPIIMEIFSSRFADKKAEWHFCQESWHLKKKLALWAALWLIANWVLGCIFIPHNPVSNIDKVFYYELAPVLSLPIVFMVMYDWPRTRPYVYQGFLVVSVWGWPFVQVITIISCGYYTERPHCYGKDFLETFYYATALQTIALFGLRLNRFPAALTALIFFLFSSITIIPKRTTWIRIMVAFFIFQAFLIYVHYTSESSERRLYNLREQLKVQFKEKQKAQLNERSAWNSKRRLISYVRVPLNTALLAVQNIDMEASEAIGKEQQPQFHALRGSLNVMSKLLDDVVNFDHVDNSKFEIMNDPYAFHQVIKSLFVPLELATKARNLAFESELDPNIDILARQASYQAMGAQPEAIHRHIREHPDVSGIVLGDEVRLRQIITNLASNACKFTPAGGKLIIRTKLIIPSLPDGFDPLRDSHETSDSDATKAHKPDQEVFDRQVDPEDVETDARPPSHRYLTLHSIEHGGKPQEVSETLVVRIELEDTGCGIKPRDIYVGKPFTDSNQTEQSTQPDEKGTGLGLALVQRLVKLSGGRLGVRSEEGQGSTFWVELPLGIGKETCLTDPHVAHENSSTTPPSENASAQRPVNQQLRPHDIGFDFLTVAESSAKAVAPIPLQVPPHMMPGAVALPIPLYGGVARRAQGHSQSGLQRLASAEPFPGPSLSPEPVAPNQGPTFVRMPRIPTFTMSPSLSSLDENSESTLSDNTTSANDSFLSKLRLFDSSRAPNGLSSSFAGIEPGLPVLVVDDDSLTRTLMKRILTRLGCEVSTAENGEAALELILGIQVKRPLTLNTVPIPEQAIGPPVFDEGKFAVIFLDNQMPLMSGLKVAEKLREYHRHDFIVGVTGNALLSDQEEYLAAGADRVLTKPVLEKSLRNILTIAAERRKACLKSGPSAR